MSEPIEFVLRGNNECAGCLQWKPVARFTVDTEYVEPATIRVALCLACLTTMQQALASEQRPAGEERTSELGENSL